MFHEISIQTKDLSILVQFCLKASTEAQRTLWCVVNEPRKQKGTCIFLLSSEERGEADIGAQFLSQNVQNSEVLR